MDAFDYIHAHNSTREDTVLKGFGVPEEDINAILEKGGKAAAMGEIRTFNGKQYEKKPYGWKLLAKGHPQHASNQAAAPVRIKPAKALFTLKEAKAAAAVEGVTDTNGVFTDKAGNVVKPHIDATGHIAFGAPVKKVSQPVQINQAALKQSDDDAAKAASGKVGKRAAISQPATPPPAPKAAPAAPAAAKPGFSHKKQKGKFYVSGRARGGADFPMKDDEKGYYEFDTQKDAESYAQAARDRMKNSSMGVHYWVEDHKGNQPD